MTASGAVCILWHCHECIMLNCIASGAKDQHCLSGMVLISPDNSHANRAHSAHWESYKS